MYTRITNCYSPVEKELNLDDLEINKQDTPPFLQSLVEFLNQHSEIQSLNLSMLRIDCEGAKILARVIPQTNITALNLSDCLIGDEAMKLIAASLPQTKITSLFVGGNNLGPDGTQALANVLPQTSIN